MKLEDVPLDYQWLVAREYFLQLMVKKKALEIGRVKTSRNYSFAKKIKDQKYFSEREFDDLIRSLRINTLSYHSKNLLHAAEQSLKNVPSFISLKRESASSVHVQLSAEAEYRYGFIRAITRSNIPINFINANFSLNQSIAMGGTPSTIRNVYDIINDYDTLDAEIKKLKNSISLIDMIYPKVKHLKSEMVGMLYYSYSPVKHYLDFAYEEPLTLESLLSSKKVTLRNM